MPAVSSVHASPILVSSAPCSVALQILVWSGQKASSMRLRMVDLQPGQLMELQTRKHLVMLVCITRALWNAVQLKTWYLRK